MRIILTNDSTNTSLEIINLSEVFICSQATHAIKTIIIMIINFKQVNMLQDYLCIRVRLVKIDISRIMKNRRLILLKLKIQKMIKNNLISNSLI